MKRIIFGGLMTALCAVSTQAQDLPGSFDDIGGFEVEEATTGLNLNRYIGGSLGLVSANGDTVGRQLGALRIDVNLPASDRLKTVLSIDAVDFENTYTQELDTTPKSNRAVCASEFPNGIHADVETEPGDPPQHPGRPLNEVEDAAYLMSLRDHEEHTRRYNLWHHNNNCADLLSDAETGFIPVERETKVTDNIFDLREAYIQWQPTDFATVTLGRQNLVWGQFDFLSPIGFLLPFRNTNTSSRPNRADFSFAQDAVSVSLFPTGNSELQLITVPEMRIDQSVEENLKAYAARRVCGSPADGHKVMCAANSDGDMSPLFPDVGDYDMSALRYNYYGERLTFAITALDGAQASFDPHRDAKLTKQGCPSGEGFCWENDKGLVYAPLETVGLEFSYVLNDRWTLKGEYTAYEALNSLSFTDFDVCIVTACLAEAVVAHGGKPYYKTDDVFIALGGIYEGDKWFGHLQIVSIDSQPSSIVDEELDCLRHCGVWQNQSCVRGNDDDDSSVAPIFFIGRRLGLEDDGFAGFGGTAFFNAYGAGFFSGWRFNENVEIAGFVGAVIDVVDTGPPDEELYDTVDDGDALAQFGINYLF